MANKKIQVDLVATDKVSEVFVQVHKNAVGAFSAIDKSIASFNNGLRHYNSSMYTFNRAVLGALDTAKDAVVDFTTDSIKAYSSFEMQHAKTMGAMAADYDKTAASQKRFMDDQKRLSDQAIRLGKFGPDNKGSLFSPQDISMAQESLVKAGVNPTDILNTSMLDTIIKFSAGNNIPLDTSTDFAVSLGTQFDIDPDKWAAMLDKVTRAADISIIEISDIIQSMKYAGGITSSMDRPLEEVLGIISTMGNAGLKGSMAGSGVQSFFTRILTANGDLSEKVAGAAPGNAAPIFEAFRAGITDKNGNLINMDKISDMLDQAYGVMNDEESTWFSKRLFGLFQMKSAYAISRHDKDGNNLLEDNTQKISETYNGANQLKYDIMMATQSGRITALQQAWKSMQTDFGQAMSPLVVAVADELYDFLNDTSNYKHINFARLKQAIEESGDLIGEGYGDTISNIFKDVANIGIDSGRIMGAVAPTAGGMVQFITELMQGNWKDGWDKLIDNIHRTNENIDGLPPELQDMAEAVNNALLAIGAISAMNLSAKLLELGSTVIRYTIGPVITLIGTELTKGLAKMLGAEDLVRKITDKAKAITTMTVNAGVVHVNSTGTSGSSRGVTGVPTGGKSGTKTTPKGTTPTKDSGYMPVTSGSEWNRMSGIDKLGSGFLIAGMVNDAQRNSMDSVLSSLDNAINNRTDGSPQGMVIPSGISSSSPLIPSDINKAMNDLLMSMSTGTHNVTQDTEYMAAVNQKLAELGYHINTTDGIPKLEQIMMSPSSVEKIYGNRQASEPKSEPLISNEVIQNMRDIMNNAVNGIKPPNLSVQPKFDINVHVDKDGNVTEKSVIPDYNSFNKWYDQESLRFGK